MPSRINVPGLSLLSSHNAPSSASTSKMSSSPFPIPTRTSRKGSTSTSPTPTSPPARLHLRNILPASPELPPIMPPPPRAPKAWVWQCHRCQSIYRLGCTRRCLDCSHTYCVSNAAQGRGKKRRRGSGICGAEFDYAGWEQWGSWRRKVLGFEAHGRCDPKARDRAFLKKATQLLDRLRLASECNHRRYELAAEALRKQMYLQDEPSAPLVLMPAASVSLDDDMPSEAVAQNEGAAERETEEVPPKSPLGQSSFLWDDDEPDTRKTREEEEIEEEGKKWWAARSALDSTDTHTGGQTFSDISRQDWGAAEGSGNDGRRLIVQNLTDNDIIDNSDSDSESDNGSWSSCSMESDDTSVETGDGTNRSLLGP